MGELADRLADEDVPAEWRARQQSLNGETEVVTGPMKPVATDEELLRTFGYDPADIEVVGDISQWRKQLRDGSWRVSYFFKHRPRKTALDLPALYAAARKRVKPVAPSKSGRTLVVCLSDPQIGKTGSRGGTPELIDRLVEKREKLTAHARRVKPERTVLLEVGDLFENFESGGNPMFSNDLSLSQQMDLAATELLEFVKLLSRFAPVTVAGVPSNHTAWRAGKTQLGKPSDDLGLFVHRQVVKIAEAMNLPAEWVWPSTYDESVLVEVAGARIGMVHGNQFNSGGAVAWWAKQQHGGQPVAGADILVSGHFHKLTVLPTGRNPHTGRAKWWLQCPTLDAGSDWFRNVQGEDSDPGLLVFEVDDETGFDLQSLTVL